MNIPHNVELRPLVTLSDSDGWETSVANAFKTIFYTGNFFACYSADGSKTFSRVSPKKIAESVGEKFCCDQHVIYLPAVNLYVWILLADPILMRLASPEDIVSSKGKAWTVYVLNGAVFHRERGTLWDYPQVSFGDNFLYLTFNFLESADAIVCRFAFGQLRERGTLHFQFFVAAGKQFICPCQFTGERGLFVVQNTTSQLRVYDWKENSNVIHHHDINIATIPTDDWIMNLPDGNKWLEPGSKIDTAVTGVTRRRGIWAAWSGARRVAGQRQNSFAHPHIGIAIISVQSFKLVGQRYLWNAEHAFAYPALSSNPSGQIALTFCWGGDRHFVQHGVGFLNDPVELWSTTSSKGLTAGGHYITARMAFPEIDRFLAAGFNSPPHPTKAGAYRNDPRYVVFER